jgi:hypothetical protein
MLLYVEWKIDPNMNNKINILRILVNKDDSIKYVPSKSKFLLGSQTVLQNEEYDFDTIYFTRVKVGSGNKIENGEKNDVEILVIEKFYDNKKTIKVYMYSTKAARTLNMKEIYYYEISPLNYGSNDVIKNNLLAELKKYNVTNINCQDGSNFIIKSSTEMIV